MARSRKRSRLYLNNQISRSQALAYLAQNEINQAIVPAVEVEDPQSETEDVDQEQDEGDSECKMLFEDNFDSFAGSSASNPESTGEESSQDGGFSVEDLSAGDSYSPEQQLHVMLGGEFGEEDDKILQDEEVDSLHEENGLEDMIELDAQEQAMLDLLQLCQDAGTSLQFFDNLVTTLRRHGRKGFYICSSPFEMYYQLTPMPLVNSKIS